MKTYEQWSSRAKQLGWSPDQYSQQAYQGYVNNMQQQSIGGGNSGGNSAPMAYQPPPLQQDNEIQEQIKQLADALEDQTNQNQALLNKLNQKPVDASKAMNSTLLTGTVGVTEDKKKKGNYLAPFGG